MSLLNPGKRGIYTLLSVLLIIGVPGMIAYAESSEDTYFSTEDYVAPLYVQTYDSDNGSTKFGVTSTVSDDVTSVIIDEVSANELINLSDISPSRYSIWLEPADEAFDVKSSRISFSIDGITPTSVVFNFYHSDTNISDSFTLTYDSESELYEYELSAIEAAAIGIADQIIISVSCAADAAVSTFDYTFAIEVKESIFTDEVIELIVLVGGILLLVLGTMALSFFDVTTPGKAFRSAGRSVKNITRRK